MLGVLWGSVLHRSVAKVMEEPSGVLCIDPTLSSRLPAGAEPHLRAAVAWAAVSLTPVGPEQHELVLALRRDILAGERGLPGLDPGSAVEPKGVSSGHCGTRQKKTGDEHPIPYLELASSSRLSAPYPARYVELAAAAAIDCQGTGPVGVQAEQQPAAR